MAGGNNHKSSASHGDRSSFSHSSHRKPANTHPHPSAAANNAHYPNSSKPSSGPPPPVKPSPRPGPSPGTAQLRPPIDPNSPLPHFSDLAALGPPPPPSYDIHMLERRTIVLADGSVRSYFALPPDYQDFPLPTRMDPAGRFLPGLRPEFSEMHLRRRQQDYWSSLGLDASRAGPSEASGKRKLGEVDERERLEEAQDKARKRQQLLQYGNADGPMTAGPRSGFFQAGGGGFLKGGEEFGGSKHGRENVRLKHLEVDKSALKKAFLHFVKLLNENSHHKKNYIQNGRTGALKCLACSRSSRDFPDMHSLIMHTYNPENADSLVDHLGLHKALCTLMGWNHSKLPDNSKAYQSLSSEQAITNQEDLIVWPPTVIIHNTVTGKNKEGRMEGVGIKSMDNLIRELGFMGGKSKSLYGREGHLGITLVKFASDKSGLREAMKLSEHFEKENHGRSSWSRVQPVTLGKEDETNPNLVRVDGRSGEKRRIFYGFLATAADLDKLDFDTKKKVTIESLRECISSS